MSADSKKTILITGCSSGIGICVANGLKDRGHHVIATARRKEDVTRLQLNGFDAYHLDLRDSLSIQNAVKETLYCTKGRLDVLFNNGAYGQAGAVEDLSRDALREQFETNLFGWHELTNLILPVMRKQGHGRIIQNSSVLGFVSLPYRGAYNASKYALEGLSDTLRQELRGSNIHLSLIEPGPIKSKFRENALNAFNRHIDVDKSAHKIKYKILLERLGKKGSASVFTLTPEAVLKKVIHAIEHPKPKIRYYVTFPTYLFGFLKRVLSQRILDNITSKVE
ncbi:MAG: SDR family oxidoreductase [Gammaproteobacteria bacterium]